MLIQLPAGGIIGSGRRAAAHWADRNNN